MPKHTPLDTRNFAVSTQKWHKKGSSQALAQGNDLSAPEISFAFHVPKTILASDFDLSFARLNGNKVGRFSHIVDGR